jgi:hypothetical protein
MTASPNSFDILMAAGTGYGLEGKVSHPADKTTRSMRSSPPSQTMRRSSTPN